MHTALTTLVNRLDHPVISRTEVIAWGAPVPSFGDVDRARVASLGLNPSNREFVDEHGRELEGSRRRFHTLNSLGISTWAEADARHLELIVDSCRRYFLRNPYDLWFKKLDHVIGGANASFYSADSPACHLDLIPYATARKWTELTPRQRTTLLDFTADALGMVLRRSPVSILILNGKSVVEQFQEVLGTRLEEIYMQDWALNRSPKPAVRGFAYRGMIDEIGEVDLGRRILVLGYNHNLQSSFGVTRKVIEEIEKWISRVVAEFQS